MEVSKQTARINNWFVAGDRLIGNVTEHPHQVVFDSNVSQMTGRIVERNIFLEEGDEVETENTVYTLGREYHE